jgi:hypothetical protein
VALATFAVGFSRCARHRRWRRPQRRRRRLHPGCANCKLGSAWSGVAGDGQELVERIKGGAIEVARLQGEDGGRILLCDSGGEPRGGVTRSIKRSDKVQEAHMKGIVLWMLGIRLPIMLDLDVFEAVQDEPGDKGYVLSR